MDLPRFIRHLNILVIFCFIFSVVPAQQNTFDNKEYTRYRPGYFKPKRGIFYSLYVSPVFTVDPLGLGGKSTYALSAGARFNLWESRSPQPGGLKIKGWYLGAGYEYYPQQFDAFYISAWMSVKTFIPLAGKIDWMYAFDEISSGLLTRYCVGIELWKVTLFLAGSVYAPIGGQEHPVFRSDYTTAGSILLIIPIYTRD